MEHNLAKSLKVSCSIKNRENDKKSTETKALGFCPNCSSLRFWYQYQMWLFYRIYFGKVWLFL